MACLNAGYSPFYSMREQNFKKRNRKKFSLNPKR